MTFTFRQKMRAAQREAGYRRFVYPKRVAAGKMRQHQADEEIAIMDEIAADYGRAAEREEKKEKLPL
jgi:hypothetical protein